MVFYVLLSPFFPSFCLKKRKKRKGLALSLFHSAPKKTQNLSQLDTLHHFTSRSPIVSCFMAGRGGGACHTPYRLEGKKNGCHTTVKDDE